MSGNYFSRLVSETRSRVWVNNPTNDEIDLALAQGAVGCTTNPGWTGGLLKRAPSEVAPDLAEAVELLPEGSIAEVADLLQLRRVSRVVERFRPVFEDSGGALGFVSIQGAPEADTDGEKIWLGAEASHAVGPNATPKIPATLPGLVAFDRVVESGWPVIVTEVFSLDQVVVTCERYREITAKTGVQPPFFMSPITGILGDYLKKLARERELDVPVDQLEIAGVYLGRRCASLVAEREYPVTLLFGGARRTDDLTCLVGGAHHATINWSTFAEIIALDPPLERTIDRAPDSAAVERLLAEFPDFWSAWELGRLAPEEFEEFGPVLYFREIFASNWNDVEKEIAALRGAID